MRTLPVAAVLTLVTLTSFAQLGPRNDRGLVGGGRTFDNFGATGGRCVLAGYRGSGLEDLPTPRNIDRSGFVYGRLRYHPLDSWRQHSRSEVPWHHDYPDGDKMLPDALERLTRIHTTPDSYQLVDIDSKELFKYPFVYLSEPGYLDLLPEDTKNLREYLDRGGFLFIDDFRGNERDNSEMENLIFQLQKLYPDRDLVPIPPSHPIFHVFFDLDPTRMLPPYVRQNSGQPQFLGIMDGLCSINESGTAVQLGINYAIYAMTH
jgi:hypothetical protein